MSSLAPIVLFVYNRPWHTQQTIAALQKNELANESELFVYCDNVKNEDAQKSVDEVRNYVDSINGFKKVTVIKREKNWGLADSIIDGVTKIVNEYGKVIVLEDDLVTSSYFLHFLNESLDFYKKNKDIFAISGYSPNIKIEGGYKYDVYLTHRGSSWGWATWKENWDTIVWDHEFYIEYLKDKKIIKDFGRKGGRDRVNILKKQLKGDVDSWAVRRGFSQFIQKKYTLYPFKTLVSNIGFDGSGVHCGVNHFLNDVKLNKDFSPKLVRGLKINENVNNAIYSYHTNTIFKKIINKIKSYISQ
jgi:hypothetical protein